LTPDAMVRSEVGGPSAARFQHVGGLIMATTKSLTELRAELADARRTILELEEENTELQDRIDEIAGIAGEDVDDEDDEDEDDEVDAA
jgi:hypothetical protein